MFNKVKKGDLIFFKDGFEDLVMKVETITEIKKEIRLFNLKNKEFWTLIIFDFGGRYQAATIKKIIG